MELIKGSYFLTLITLLAAGFFLQSCRGSDAEVRIVIETDEEFADHWYKGKAEITTYRMNQGHYGSQYDAVATLIFVTEDFDVDKHVKPDHEDVEGQELSTVLKLNKEKRFLTGIYPYTMMTSVFTPITGEFQGRGLKVTSSALEWCGQTFTQWNRESNGGWTNRSFSYFERQGDRTQSFPNVWLEDELWTLLRLDPAQLPRDSFEIITGNMNLREKVANSEVRSATASERVLNDSIAQYELNIHEPNRRLRINYRRDFPHRIVAWEEEFFRHGDKVVHRAEKYKTTMIDYWNRNAVADSTLYLELMPDDVVR
jgi:hypothetical protein